MGIISLFFDIFMYKLIASIILFTVLSALLPTVVFAKTLPAGFASNQIWFSKDPFFVGDHIAINTLVFNSTPYQMTGVMTLRDGTTTVEKRSILVEGNGGSQVVVFPWVVTPGLHNFSAVILSDTFTEGTSSVASSTVSIAETVKVKRFADLDSNHNGIGDSTEPAPPPKKIIPTSTTTNVGTTTQSQVSSNPIEEIKNQISENAPVPVSSMALPVISSIEQIRLSQSIKASKNLNSAVGNITAHSGTTSSVHVVTQNDKDIAGWSLVAGGIKNGQIVRSPLDYIKLFLALVIYSFVSNPYIFYIAFLLVFYKIVRIMISLFF